MSLPTHLPLSPSPREGHRFLRPVVVAALPPLALHLLSVGILFASTWGQQAHQVKSQISSIAVHVVGLQLQLTASIAALGLAAGCLAWFALRAAGARARAWQVTLLAAAILGWGVLRAIARKPALFEELLWRTGGLRATFEVALAEGLGYRALDRFLLATAIVWAGLAAWQQRRRITPVRLGVCLGLLSAVGLGRWALGHHGTSRPAARPVIVLAADSLRPDHFGSERYGRETTPNLDRLRQDSAWLSDAFVPIASTTASWTTLLTGLYPHRHGVRDLFPRDECTHVFVPTLPRILAEHGYQTAVVSDYAGEMFNRMDYGFGEVDAAPSTSLEVFADREAFQRLPLALALLCNGAGEWLFPFIRYLPVNADADLLSDHVEAALDHLERTGQPFLLVAFYSVTHAPFAAPMPDAAKFTSPSYAGPSRYSYELQQLSDLARASARPSDEEIRQVRGLYDGGLYAFDRQVGRVLARLDADGIKDRIVIVLGDHGENLFEPGTTTEHGKWFKGGEAANRTAMMFQAPGLPAGDRPQVASGVDFLPTLLKLLSINPPPGLDGVDALSPEVPANRTVFAETTLWLGGPASTPEGAMSYPGLVDLLEVSPRTHAVQLKRRYQDTTITAKLRAARSGPWELVYTPTTGAPRYQLFDLRKDPFGEHDLSGEAPPVLAPLRQELLGWISEDPLRWLDANDRLVLRVEQ